MGTKTIPYSEILLKTERKKLKELSILYTNVVLYSHYLQRENYKADRRYYKLLKKYKSLKKEMSVRFDIASENVLKREWDTPEEDKAWEGLLDESSGVINSSGNSSIGDAVEAVKDDDLYKRGEG